jgi:SNF2 family DNA or RNA helicase
MEESSRELNAARAAPSKGSSGLARVAGALSWGLSWLTGSRQATTHAAETAEFGWLNDRQGLGGLGSSRMRELRRLVESIFREYRGEKIVLVSVFQESLRLVAELLQREFDQEPMLIHGAIEPDNRTAAITRFQQSEDVRHRVMLITYQAGGVGINLQRGNHLVLLDGEWTYAREVQAIARVNRIGQTRPVHVYELRAEIWIDRNMADKRARKREILEELVGEDGAEMVDAEQGDAEANEEAKEDQRGWLDLFAGI